MSAVINSSGHVVLAGDNANWSRSKTPLPTAPTGTTSMIVASKVVGEAPSSVSDTPAWDASYYWGLSFDGNHIEYPTVGLANFEAAFANFFGPFMVNYTGTANSMNAREVKSGGTSNDVRRFVVTDNSTSDLVGIEGIVADGNGSSQFPLQNEVGNGFYFLDSTSGYSVAPFCPWTRTSISQSDDRWQIWWIRKDASNNKVYLDAWLSAVDPDTIGIGNIDNDNPRGDLTPSSQVDSGTAIEYFELQGDTFGTNWIPTDGNFAVPSHFLARWPFYDGSLSIEYLAVQYATLTT